MGVLFACGACGSPSVELPRAFADSAGVHCKRCGLQLGTWGAFKEQTKKLIVTELAASGQTEGVRSSDPLPGLNSGSSVKKAVWALRRVWGRRGTRYAGPREPP